MRWNISTLNYPRLSYSAHTRFRTINSMFLITVNMQVFCTFFFGVKKKGFLFFSSGLKIAWGEITSLLNRTGRDQLYEAILKLRSRPGRKTRYLSTKLNFRGRSQLKCRRCLKNTHSTTMIRVHARTNKSSQLIQCRFMNRVSCFVYDFNYLPQLAFTLFLGLRFWYRWQTHRRWYQNIWGLKVKLDTEWK